MPPTAFFIDLDGVVYRGQRCLDGAAAFIHKLETGGHPYLFLTNNSAHHPDEYVRKLHACGIAARRAQVYTASDAAADALREELAGRPVFVLGETGLIRVLEEAGVPVATGEGPRTTAGPSGAAGRPPAEAAAVLVGELRHLDYAALCQAARLVAAGAPLFATNPDRTIPDEDGFIVGCGSITAVLETATGQRARYFGKPNPDMARRAARRLGVPLEHCAVIGDGWETDIALAHALGLPSILIQAGAATVAGHGFRPDQQAARPTWTVPSLAALLDADLDAILGN
ncbi:MAG TPA: HAD-IIA family hydrolase [Limnochordales bacterium]